MRTQQVNLGPITSVAELSQWMSEQVQKGHVDIDVPAKTLRDEWLIVDEVTDEQVEAVITEVFRKNPGPNVVLTLCNGTIVAEAGIGRNGEIQDAIGCLERTLSDTYEGTVSLSKAETDGTGYGVGIAWRMPPRYYRHYKAGDGELVERFGVEVGRYRQHAGHH